MKSGSIFAIVLFSSMTSAPVGAVVTAGMVQTPARSEGGSGMRPAEVKQLLAEQEQRLRDTLAKTPAPSATPISAPSVSAEELYEALDARMNALAARLQSDRAVTSGAAALDEAELTALQALAEQIRELENMLGALNRRFDSYEAGEGVRDAQRARERQEQQQRRMMEGMLQAAPALAPQMANFATSRLAEQLQLDETQRPRVQEALQKSMLRGAEIVRASRIQGDMTDEQAQAELQKLMDETNTDMRGILTPSQYSQWEELANSDNMRRGFPGMPGMPGQPRQPGGGSQGF